MRRNLALSILVLPLATTLSMAQQGPSGPPQNLPVRQTSVAQPVQEASAAHQQKSAAQTAEPGSTALPADRNFVLEKMNETASSFKAAQADFDFESYQKIVQESDHQKGRIYFRRTKNGVDAAFDMAGPAPKQVVYKDGKLYIYEKKIEQVTERTVGSNKSDVEAFLSLGFGARGDEMLRDYDVTMDGWETVDGIKTAKLDLTPKKENVRRTYNKIVLWIDPLRDVLLKQQFFEPSGDYRLAHYTNMKLSAKLPDDVFRLKTSGNTRTVKSQ